MSSEANEWAQWGARAKRAVLSKQRVSGASEWASGPLLTSRFEGILNHCAGCASTVTSRCQRIWCQANYDHWPSRRSQELKKWIDIMPPEFSKKKKIKRMRAFGTLTVIKRSSHRKANVLNIRQILSADWKKKEKRGRWSNRANKEQARFNC